MDKWDVSLIVTFRGRLALRLQLCFTINAGLWCLVISNHTFIWHGPHTKTEVGPQLVKSNSHLLFTPCSPLTDAFFYCNKKLSLLELTALFPSPLLNLIWTKIDEQTLKHSRFTMAVGPGSLMCRGSSCWKSFYDGSYTLMSLLILEELGSVYHNKHKRKRVRCLLRWCCFLCKHGGINSRRGRPFSFC